jgi:hypothetical protein
MTRPTILAAFAALLATAAHAQSPGAGSGPGAVDPFGGRSVTSAPRFASPTPLFAIGDLAVGIWARVPPPYDATANRNIAANPLP